ncbi:TPA: hypothetical protein HA251_00915 [Candidatus Woesearchaeota archaeon]|nr:hypothetical protein [Candidatus Woesearchaeota archaeon]
MMVQITPTRKRMLAGLIVLCRLAAMTSLMRVSNVMMVRVIVMLFQGHAEAIVRMQAAAMT